jgi:hypothetical protein
VSINNKKFLFNNNNIITSNNFSRNADVVFSESINNFEYDEIVKKTNTCKVTSDSETTLYFLTKFSLKENDIIFCNTIFVEELFKILKNVTNLKNLKLITSQSDLQINKSLYKKKPNCISTWYAVNVSFDNPNLIPIPLGLPETRSSKNVIFDDLEKIKKIPKGKIPKIFSNFNLNTKYFHRYRIAKKGFENPSFTVMKANLNYQNYITQVTKHKYTIAPWGNGIDTHRLWEILYSGSIPVTFYHKTFKNFNDLPILFIKSMKDLDVNYLEKQTIRNDNYDKLYVNWWIDLIKAKKITSSEAIDVELSLKEIKKIKKTYKSKITLINSKKKFYTIFRKVHKKTIGIKVNRAIGF